MDHSKTGDRKADLERRVEKTVSSTVFDRGFPWNVGQMPRQGLEESFLLKFSLRRGRRVHE